MISSQLFDNIRSETFRVNIHSPGNKVIRRVVIDINMILLNLLKDSKIYIGLSKGMLVFGVKAV